MADVIANAAQTNLAASMTAATTTMTVASASALPGSGPYRVMVDQELMEVTSGFGTTTLTVTRAVEGPAPYNTAATHSSGAGVTLKVTAAMLNNYLTLDGAQTVTGAKTFGATLTVASGGAIITTGGLTVSAGGATVTGALTFGATAGNQSVLLSDSTGNLFIQSGSGSTGTYVILRPAGAGSNNGALLGDTNGAWNTYSSSGSSRNVLDDGSGNMRIAGVFQIVSAYGFGDKNSGNKVLTFTDTGPANHFDFSNSSAGSPLVLSAVGTDTNIGLTLTPKGTGIVTVSGALSTSNDRRLSRQTPAFAASYTPDPTLGEIISMAALTAAITVNAVAAPVVGQRMTFDWLQDGTGGRTITYNAVYHTGGGATLVTTASTHTIDSFFYDGAVWRLMSRITGQT